MDNLFKHLEYFKWAFAGFIGALVAVRFQNDLKTKGSIVIFVLSGSAYAHYLTGLVGDYFNIAPSSVGGIGFLLGAFGGSLTAAIIRAISSSDLVELLRKKIGGSE